MQRQPHIPVFSSRRDFLVKAGGGFGALALGCLLGRDGVLSAADNPPVANPLAPRPSPHPATAKSVIFLFMEGGPSHIDTFDPKPELARAGQRLPASFGTVITPMGTGGNILFPSRRTFRRNGRSGIPVSDWLPHMATCADDLAVVRSCWADGLNHVGSVCQMNTGSILAGRPSLGSWVIYGLGSVNQNMPGFVVMTDTTNEVAGGPRNWGTGFMPATFQGTHFRPGASPVLHLRPPTPVDPQQQRNRLDLLQALNEEHRRLRPDDTELSARMASYELAFRMQAAAPEAVDLAQESERTKEEYGLNRPECAEFGRRCLLARRLVERGVRFVQVYCGTGSQWDAHSDLEGNHTRMCTRCDQPSAALIKDLKRRGLLEDTLVIWGGEFGRTPMTEGTNGRDHNPYGFTMVFAGGGVKAGHIVGSTDEFGLHAVDNRIHVHDLHATILHALGFNHLRLTFMHNGREERLTINDGRVVRDLFA